MSSTVSANTGEQLLRGTEGDYNSVILYLSNGSVIEITDLNGNQVVLTKQTEFFDEAGEIYSYCPITDEVECMRCQYLLSFKGEYSCKCPYTNSPSERESSKKSRVRCEECGKTVDPINHIKGQNCRAQCKKCGKTVNFLNHKCASM